MICFYLFLKKSISGFYQIIIILQKKKFPSQTGNSLMSGTSEFVRANQNLTKALWRSK